MGNVPHPPFPGDGVHGLVFEGTAAEEFAKNGGGGNFSGGHALDVGEEFQETLGFGVFRVFGLNLVQQRDGLLFQGA